MRTFARSAHATHPHHRSVAPSSQIPPAHPPPRAVTEKFLGDAAAAHHFLAQAVRDGLTPVEFVDARVRVVLPLGLLVPLFSVLFAFLGRQVHGGHLPDFVTADVYDGE